MAKPPALILLAILAFLSLQVANLRAKPVTAKKAEVAVRGWLKIDRRPVGIGRGRQTAGIETFSDANGQPMYYVFYMRPSGFVIVAADDLVEPVIAFADDGVYEGSDDNPLGALVSRDVPGRIAAARAIRKESVINAVGQKDASERATAKAQAKWSKLRNNGELVQALGLSGVSDVRVAPLLQSRWSQRNEGGLSCYNYYTPPNAPNTPSNYPCGCVATAMAQFMRLHEHPVAGIGTHPFTIEVDYIEETAWTRGGDGAGGPYNWTQMVLDPDSTISGLQRQAIGALCHDAGVSVNMYYEEDGSSADTLKAKDSLTTIFGYSNAIKGYNSGGNIGAGLNGMINPNLDYGNPVILGITGISGGHAIVVDGYGYDLSTQYHHLNMGWAGSDDAWYDLPDIDSSPAFTSVHKAVYNVFTSGSGEIISGRVTDPGGGAISNVNITAQADGGGKYYATSNSEGIFALGKVPSNTTFTITADKGSWIFSSEIAHTASSTDYSQTSGNVWGVNLIGTTPAGVVDLEKDTYLVPETIIIKVADRDLQGNGVQEVTLRRCGGDFETVTLTENPPGSGAFAGSITSAEDAPIIEDGTLQAPSRGSIIIATYNDADDGTGHPATARDTAVVICPIVLCEADFTAGIPGDWSVVNGGSGPHTWAPGNEADWLERTVWDGTLTGDFVIVDSDSAPDEDMDEQLITPNINCSAYDEVLLKFRHQFVYYSGDDVADVDVRVNGGGWQNAVRYQGDDVSGDVELDLSSIAAGQPNVQIRWHYYNANWDYYWGIDDVVVTAAVSGPQQTLGDFEPDCDVDFYDFAVFSRAWQSKPGSNNWNPVCDISEPNDSIINALDLAGFSENWLEGVDYCPQ